LLAKSSANNYIEFDTGGYLALIDFHTNSAYVRDWDARILIGGTTTDANSTASMSIDASFVQINTRVIATSFNATSDYRIKTDIVLLSDISYNVDHLKPIKYTNTQLKKDDMGFIAHEVQEIFPFLVTGVKDGEEKQTLNYNGFIALLVKEVQDLKKENIDLKTRLDAIEKRLM
jgi:hypothetical protein